MFTVSAKTHFRALHQLTLPDGSKEPLHRHNWSVTAGVSSGKLNSMGVVIDFHQLRAMVDNIVADFSNTSFDKIDYFQRNSASTENVAMYIYEKLEPKLPKGIKLDHIKVVEQRGCSVKYGK